MQKTAKKKIIFQKWDHFKNCQKWPSSKGYSLCKIVTLGQNLKMQKTLLKPFLKHIIDVLCKKRLEKTANIRKIRLLWKLPKMATKQRLLPLQNRHFRSKIKNGKKIIKLSLQHNGVVLCNKRLEKTANTGKMRPF